MLSGYWNEAVRFFSGLFNATFKINNHLERGLITGITRIAKESNIDIYNPWSIVSFIKKKGNYDTYWANASGNGLVNSLIQTGDPGIKQTMEELLQGKSFEAELDEKIVFDQLTGSAKRTLRDFTTVLCWG